MPRLVLLSAGSIALLALVGCAASTAATEPIPPAARDLAAGDHRDTPGRLIHTDDFTDGLGAWVVEQQPGGRVFTERGGMIIEDVGGCTVWFREKLKSPVVISYAATMAEQPRVSDLNCFWMATDPARPDALLDADHRRDGKFASYDRLRLYYVGYGGNDNTTTRFRRYAGDGNKPLLPEHDLSKGEVLLRAGHRYRIELRVTGDRVQFARDGEVLFDFCDPHVLSEGWFGIRTVNSRIEIRDFVVREGGSEPANASALQ